MPPTHFLCLPLITSTSRPQLEQSLACLRETTRHGDYNIPESAYRPLGVLHITLGVMYLTPQRLQAALQMLQDIDLAAVLTWAANRPRTPTMTTISETESTSTSPTVLQSLNRAVSPPAETSASSRTVPLTISLKGLSAFPDTRKATVLHAKPFDPSDRLYYFCLALRQNFIDGGFMQPEERPMVLHATLVNTVYSKNSRERKGETGRGVGRITMDARELIRKLNGRNVEEDGRVKRDEVPLFVWAEGVEINSVRICKMGAQKVEDELLGMEYEVVGEKMIFSQ